MSTFLRLLSESDKAEALMVACTNLRQGHTDMRNFVVEPNSFDSIPGKSFAYWAGSAIRDSFTRWPAFGSGDWSAWVGLQTNDDFQWVRLWWENAEEKSDLFSLVPFAKGGSYSPFYADIYLTVRWGASGLLIKTWKEQQLLDRLITANNSKCWNEKNYFTLGITWPSRTQSFGPRALPSSCIFGHKGPAAFCASENSESLLARLAIMNSKPFSALVETRLNAADATARSFEVGIIGASPVPMLTSAQEKQLAELANRIWSLKRTVDTVTETSHAFVLPTALRARAGYDDFLSTEMEVDEVQAAIDIIAFDLYGFSKADCEAVNGPVVNDEETEEDDEKVETEVASTDGLLSWAVGVAFGRFDLRIATGERPLSPEPEPFDPLPSKSPGMLPDGAQSFHAHEAILVDEQGHPHDLVHLVEEVLGRVNVPVPDDVRRWLRKNFFAFHLKLFSKSRRKAPIYWPLSTASGSYTLWLYYPSLSSQILYTAVNDFIEPKLKQIGSDVTALRNKGATRSSDDEKQFEALQSFELELIELRDTMLKLAPAYKPDQNDGVQVSAAPLWSLFRHKPWQKVLKATFVKLEKGNYDWAHLAMNYWPKRVREKCKTDKSLAIAHGLEATFVETMKTSEGEMK